MFKIVLFDFPEPDCPLQTCVAAFLLANFRLQNPTNSQQMLLVPTSSVQALCSPPSGCPATTGSATLRIVCPGMCELNVPALLQAGMQLTRTPHFKLSCPQHDPDHQPKFHGGLVLKHNGNQRYATNATSATLFRWGDWVSPVTSKMNVSECSSALPDLCLFLLCI